MQYFEPVLKLTLRSSRGSACKSTLKARQAADDRLTNQPLA